MALDLSRGQPAAGPPAQLKRSWHFRPINSPLVLPSIRQSDWFALRIVWSGLRKDTPFGRPSNDADHSRAAVASALSALAIHGVMDGAGDGRGVGLVFEQVVLRPQRIACCAISSSVTPVSTTIGTLGAAAASRPIVSSPKESGSDRSSRTAFERLLQECHFGLLQGCGTPAVAYFPGYRLSNVLRTSRTLAALSSTSKRRVGVPGREQLACRPIARRDGGLRRFQLLRKPRDLSLQLQASPSPGCHRNSCPLVSCGILPGHTSAQ